jgi:hypothetical protein
MGLELQDSIYGMSAIQLNSPFLELLMQQDHADNLTPEQAGTRATSGSVDHNTKVGKKLQVNPCMGRFEA